MHAVLRDDNRQAFREHLLWGYRTGLLGLDITFLVSHTTNRRPVQRLKRATPPTIYFTASAVVIDLGLTPLFLAREDDCGRKVAQEVIALTPSIFSPLWLVPETNPKLRALAYIVLAGMNTVATFSNFGFGIKFLRDDVRALKEVS